KIRFFGRSFTIKGAVTRGKPPKALKGSPMAQRIGIGIVRLAEALARQAHAHFLVCQILGMREREIVEIANARRRFEIVAAGERVLGNTACRRIGGKRLAGAAEHVAGKLIEQNDQRERALLVVFPSGEFALARIAPDLLKPRFDFGVEGGGGDKPALLIDLLKQEIENAARRYAAHATSTESPTRIVPPSITRQQTPPRHSGFNAARRPRRASSIRWQGWVSCVTSRTSLPMRRRLPSRGT